MNFTVEYGTFQRRLRDLIESRGKLIRQVADETGISKITLSRYLNNHRDPELKYVVALARYFDVSVDWLLGFGHSRADALHPNVREAIRLYSLATPEDRNVVDAVLGKYRKRN